MTVKNCLRLRFASALLCIVMIIYTPIAVAISTYDGYITAAYLIGVLGSFSIAFFASSSMDFYWLAKTLKDSEKSNSQGGPEDN
jgi:hypothetical protein